MMKIAVAATAPDLDAEVEHKLGLSSYLLVVETESMAFEAVPVPDGGAGTKVIALALAKDARVILAGYVSPHILGTLRRNGVEVLTSVSGSAREAVGKYRRGELGAKEVTSGGAMWLTSLKKSAR